MSFQNYTFVSEGWYILQQFPEMRTINKKERETQGGLEGFLAYLSKIRQIKTDKLVQGNCWFSTTHFDTVLIFRPHVSMHLPM